MPKVVTELLPPVMGWLPSVHKIKAALPSAMLDFLASVGGNLFSHGPQVKGYITLLPIHWTEGENNNLEYHTALMTNNEQPDPFGATTTEAVAHAQQRLGEKPA